MSGFKIEVTETRGRKQATACLRGGVLEVKIPARWPSDFKQEVTDKLVRRVLQKEAKNYALMKLLESDPDRMTLATEAELTAYVRRVNAETFQERLGKVQIGDARYSRLAQVNLKTRTMTVSKYCLHDVPERALRYLIVHELAHFQEAGHNQRFWRLVGQFVPDYRQQSRLMKAIHKFAVEREEQAELSPSISPASNLPALERNRPGNTPALPPRPLPKVGKPTPPQPKAQKSAPPAPQPGWKDAIKQLLLFQPANP